MYSFRILFWQLLEKSTLVALKLAEMLYHNFDLQLIDKFIFAPLSQVSRKKQFS
jgi:hypothetical protein